MFSERELKRLEGFAEILEDGAEVRLVKERMALVGLRWEPSGEVAVAEFDRGFSELMADAIREFVDRRREAN